MERLRKPWVWLALLMLLGAALRWHVAGAKSYGFDEWYTYAHGLGFFGVAVSDAFNPLDIRTAGYFQQLVQQLPGALPWSAEHIVRCMKEEFNLPLWFFLMGGWMRLLPGFDLAIARLPALLLGVGCIPLFYAVGARLGSRCAGWAAATLCALSPYAVFYSAENRPYALLVFLSLLGSYWVLRLWERTSRRDLAALILIAWVGLCTHYFFVLVAGFWSGVLLWRHRTWKAALMTVAAWLPAVAVMAGFFLYQKDYMQQLNPLKVKHAPSLQEALLTVLSEGLILFSQFEPLREGQEPWTVLLLVVVGVMAWLVFIRRKDLPCYSLFCGVWLLSVFGGLVLLSVFTASNLLVVERYWNFVLPPVYLFAGYAIARAGTRRLQAVLSIGLAIALGGYLVDLNRALGYPTFNYRLAGRVIREKSQPGDLVMILIGFPTAAAIAQYLPADMPVTTVYSPRWTGEGHQRLAQLVQGRQRVWFVATYNQLQFGAYDGMARSMATRMGYGEPKTMVITEPEPIAVYLFSKSDARPTRR